MLELAGGDGIGQGGFGVAAGRLDQQGVPDLDGAVVHRGVGDHHHRVVEAGELGDQHAGAVVHGEGVQDRAHAVGADQGAVGAALALDGVVALEFVLVLFHGGAVDGAQVAVVADVVDDFLGVLVEQAQVVELPAHPGGVVPLGQAGVVPFGLAAFGVVPHPDRAEALDHRPRLDVGGGRNRALVVGDVVALAVRAEAPGVVGAADAVAFHVAAAAVDHHVGGVVGGGEVGLHVRTVGVQQHDLAGLPAAVEGEILAEEPHGEGFVGVQLFSVGDHEPSAGEGEFAESVILGGGHGSSFVRCGEGVFS